MLCVLGKDELRDAVSLYAQCHGLQRQTALNILDGFVNNVYAIKENSELKCIACASQISVNQKQGIYIHGLSAADETTAKASFEQLIKQIMADNEGSFFIASNINENKNIYEQLGFQSAFAMRAVNRDIQRNLWARADFDTITARKLCEKRNTYIGDMQVKITSTQASALLSLLYSKGISSAETAKAYALYYRMKDRLVIAELYAETDVDAWFLLEAIADRDGRNTASILLSGESSVFSGEGQRFYAGLAHGLSNGEFIFLGEMPN